MKRLLIGTLSTVALFTLAVPALGNDLVRVNSWSTRNIVKISPFNLVSGGYQGLFKEQGIPSSGSFVTSVRANKITAEDLIESAIAKGRLPESTLEDDAYINEVEFLLDGLDKN